MPDRKRSRSLLAALTASGMVRLRKIPPLHAPKTDGRLLGTWRSDKRRTLKEWAFKPGLARRHRQRFRGIFGRLKITYTRRRIHSVLGRWRYAGQYHVIGRDANSVAIMYWDVLCQEWQIEHIHFDGKDSYWVSVGWNREFFRRVRR